MAMGTDVAMLKAPLFKTVGQLLDSTGVGRAVPMAPRLSPLCTGAYRQIEFLHFCGNLSVQIEFLCENDEARGRGASLRLKA